MKRSKTCLSILLASNLFIAIAAHAAVSWDVSVTFPSPAPVAEPLPSLPSNVAVYQAPIAQAPAPAPTLPNIEHMQAQQQARVQWGAQVGLITPHEHFRLQQTQQYIEQQRQWAYADGWLTYDEHLQLIHLLNGASQQIEHKLANWQRVQQTYHPMPPVLGLWTMPYSVYGYGYRGHNSHGRPQQVTPVRPPIPVPVPGQGHNHRRERF